MDSTKFKNQQLKKLSSDLGIKSEKIKFALDNIDSFYTEYSKKKVDRKTGEIKKYKDGTVKKRIIRPSNNHLKFIQDQINQEILEKVSLPQNIQGGVKNKSNITNAKLHQGNKFQFTTDLQNFYPSINSALVYKMFLGLGYNSYYSSMLTKLTTWKYEIPQGAPTSTHLANLVFLSTDKELINFCITNEIIYTRFIDDLTFSSQKCFKHLIPEIKSIIIKDFKISNRKTKYGKVEITGVLANNNYIDAPKSIKERAKIEDNSDIEYKPINQYVTNIRRTNSSKLKKE